MQIGLGFGCQFGWLSAVVNPAVDAVCAHGSGGGQHWYRPRQLGPFALPDVL